MERGLAGTRSRAQALLLGGRVRVGLGIERPQAGHFLGRERVAGIGHREIPAARFDAQSGARQFHFDFAEVPVVALRFRRVGDFVVRVHFLHHMR